jgi:hypothetical protein
MPPISPHEFKLAFNACSNTCRFPSFHDCFELIDEDDFITRIPKKKSMFDIATQSRTARFAWGIEAQNAISLLHVVLYHLLMLLAPFGFWVWWQKLHPDDLQNASIPLTFVFVLMSLFWSATGILKTFREPQS